MVAPPKVIKVTSETTLQDVLDDAAQSPVVLERNGRRFIVTANDAAVGDANADLPAGNAAYRRRGEGAAPEAADRTEHVGPFNHLAPEPLPPTPDRETVLAILDEVAGSWTDLDIDTMIRDIYEARVRGSRGFEGS